MGRLRLTGDSGPVDYKSQIKKIPRYFVRDEKVVETHKIVVHTFQMGDVDDPDLYAAEPLYQWQQSDQGQWVMENSMDTPEWHRHTDYSSFGYKYAITAVFESKKLTEFYLRFGKNSS
jgi:hypothetical protein